MSNKKQPNPITPQFNKQFSTIQEAFTPNKVLVPRPDFKNKKQIIYNNLADIIQLEDLFEYKINISSNDRDTNSFPSPFEFVTELNAGNRMPKIDREIKNVRAIGVDYVILPKSIAVNIECIDRSQQIYPMGSCAAFSEDPPATCPCAENVSEVVSSDACVPDLTIYKCLYLLQNRPYLLLKIKEIGSPMIAGTNALIDSDTIILIYDQDLGADNALWIPLYTGIKAQHSLLKNFKRLTLKLMYPDGTLITLIDQDGNPIIGTTIHSRIDQNGVITKYDYNKFVNEFRYLNNAVKYTYGIMNVLFGFTFYILETEMDTLPKYN